MCKWFKTNGLSVKISIYKDLAAGALLAKNFDATFAKKCAKFRHGGFAALFLRADSIVVNWVVMIGPLSLWR